MRTVFAILLFSLVLAAAADASSWYVVQSVDPEVDPKCVQAGCPYVVKGTVYGNYIQLDEQNNPTVIPNVVVPGAGVTLYEYSVPVAYATTDARGKFYIVRNTDLESPDETLLWVVINEGGVDETHSSSFPVYVAKGYWETYWYESDSWSCDHNVQSPSHPSPAFDFAYVGLPGPPGWVWWTGRSTGTHSESGVGAMPELYIPWVGGVCYERAQNLFYSARMTAYASGYISAVYELGIGLYAPTKAAISFSVGGGGVTAGASASGWVWPDPPAPPEYCGSTNAAVNTTAYIGTGGSVAASASVSAPLPGAQTWWDPHSQVTFAPFPNEATVISTHATVEIWFSAYGSALVSGFHSSWARTPISSSARGTVILPAQINTWGCGYYPPD